LEWFLQYLPGPKKDGYMLPIDITKIASNDPEVLALLNSWGNRPTWSVSEIFKTGPFGRAKGYEYINSGELPTFMFGGRRFVLSMDYARFLIALKRQGTTGANPELSRAARERRLAAIASRKKVA
jgi:hypothetical protein